MFDPIRRIPIYESLPTVPSVEAWREMSPEARLNFQIEVNAALTPPDELMSEGLPHKRAKSQAADALGLHFKTIGRSVYIAEDLAVLCPNEKPFSPDIMVVLDVEPSDDDDDRMSWVVADEGKGIDLALEVLHCGDRAKDLVDNVERYALLGIAEYFVYDRARQRIHGYRLTAPSSGRYQPIIPQLGRYASGVLALDLTISDDKLQFLAGDATLPQSADLIRRLREMVSNIESKADEVQAQLAAAQDRAERAQDRAEKAQDRAEKAEKQLDEVKTQAERAQLQAELVTKSLRAALLLILDLRNIVCPNELRARIQACREPELLNHWFSRAQQARKLDDIFGAD